MRRVLCQKALNFIWGVCCNWGVGVGVGVGGGLVGVGLGLLCFAGGITIPVRTCWL